METQKHNGYSSFFWPTILISIGIIWLLKNMGVITGVNFSVLLRLWPLLLIVIGLDILFARRSPVLGAFIGLIAAGIAIGAILLSPVTNVEVKHTSFSEPVAGVEKAQITLGPSIGTTTIQSLSDSNNLIEADLAYLGEVKFDAQGESNKTVTLNQTGREFDFDINMFDTLDTAEKLRWDIKLARRIPIDLFIDGSVGKNDLDLSDLELTGLKINGGVGETNLQLPAAKFDTTIEGDVGNFYIHVPADANINADIQGGVGEFNIEISQDAAFNAQINGGVGNFTLRVPAGAAVRLDAKMDLGNINVPSSFEQISGGKEKGAGSAGVWETDNYARADRQITIVFEGDIGNLTVK